MPLVHPPGLHMDTLLVREEAALGSSLVTEEETVLLMCLGHSLVGSQSPFAHLSKDILADFVRPAIRRAHLESRAAAGLLTPPAIKWRVAPSITERMGIESIAVSEGAFSPPGEEKKRPRRMVRFGCVGDASDSAAAGDSMTEDESENLIFSRPDWGRANAPATLGERIKGVKAPQLPASLTSAKTVKKASRQHHKSSQGSSRGGGHDRSREGHGGKQTSKTGASQSRNFVQ